LGHDAFNLQSQFTLSSTEREGIKPVTEATTLQVGTFSTTIARLLQKAHEHEGGEDGGEDGAARRILRDAHFVGSSG
jgi:hypothetical protein